MKKQYDMPTAERIAFDYREQVVATSGAGGPAVDRTPGMLCYNAQNFIAGPYNICSYL